MPFLIFLCALSYIYKKYKLKWLRLKNYKSLNISPAASTHVNHLVHPLGCESLICKVPVLPGSFHLAAGLSGRGRPESIPLEMIILQGRGLQRVRPVTMKGMGEGGLGPQNRAKWREFRSCHSSHSCPVGFCPFPGEVGIGIRGMDCALSCFRALGFSSGEWEGTGQCGIYKIWLPGLNSCLGTYSLETLEKSGFFFFFISKWGQIHSLELLNKILYVNLSI